MAAPQAPSDAAAPPPLDSAAPARSRTGLSGPSLQVVETPSVDLSENRRLVTVLFADLSGSTPLAERLDPEDLRRILASYFGVLSRQIQRYGGTVDKYIGDAVMAVFGAPVAHEDDAERAINCALAMQGGIGRLNEDLEREYAARLTLRIGINTGEVVAGLLSGDLQGAYTVVGDTVNTAQRFESNAPLGGILVSETTWRLTRRAFDFETLPPITLKGKAEPQPAYRVIARRYDELEPPRTQLIGRANELARLLGAFEAVQAGQNRVVHVVGDAGVGKSRLLREFRARLPTAARQLDSRCVSFDAETPFALIARTLRQTLGLRPGDDEMHARAAIEQAFSRLGSAIEQQVVVQLLDVLGYRENSDIDPHTRRRVLLNVTQRLLASFAQGQPLVIVAEDMHWADSASTELLAEITRDVPGTRALVMTSSRSGWQPPWSADVLSLEALADRGARGLVEAAFGRPVDQELADTILARTGGNPFFIEEVVKNLQEADVLTERDGRVVARTSTPPSVPATVQEVLGARLDRLPINARRVLQPAAVCGRIFPIRVLEQLVPEPDFAESLATLERESFLIRQSTAAETVYVFRHALIQEVAYQRQLQSQRRATHGAIGEAIETLYRERLDERVDMLAFHYARSENAPKARTYLLRAGQRAQRLYAREEALASFRAALERSVDDPVARATALEGIGEIERLAGQYAEALASYNAALEARAMDDPVARASLLRKCGTVYQLQGNSEAALEAFNSALADLPSHAQRERAFVLIEIGDVRWRQGLFDEAIESLYQAIAYAERAHADDARADALRHLGTIQVLRGDAASGLAFYEQSRLLYESLGDLVGQANVHNNIGIVHRREGRYAEALDVNGKALQLRERIADPWGIAMTHNNLAELHRTRGNLDQAIEDYGAALTQWGSVGYLNGVAIARTGLGIARVESGQASAGRYDLQTALAEWEHLGSRTYLSETQRYLAQAYVAEDADAALDWAEQAVKTAQELKAVDQEGIALQVLGRVHAARGEARQAVGALERGAELLRATHERRELARTIAALGKLYRGLPRWDQRHAEADALLSEARAIFTELGAALDLRSLEEPAATH